MNLEKQLEQGGLPRTFLLRLYEKWFRATPQPQTRSVYEARWAKKWRFGSSENYAAGASETFHTVSRNGILRSSPCWVGIPLVSYGPREPGTGPPPREAAGLFP